MQNNLDPMDNFYLELSGLICAKVTSKRDLLRIIEQGIPPQSVYNLVELWGGGIHTEWFISKRTLARRLAQHQVLKQDETAAVVRFASVLLAAIDVFGSKEKAITWLKRVHPSLHHNLSPLELCLFDEGALWVFERMHAIDYGFGA